MLVYVTSENTINDNNMNIIMEIVNTITNNHYIFIAICGIFGLTIGSFLNVVIYRLPILLEKEYKKNFFEYFYKSGSSKNKTFNLAQPKSHCPKCQTSITWWQNIPILSYIILHGKCNHCKHPIPLRYPFVELLSCLASITVAIHFGPTAKMLSVLILTWALIAASFIDIEKQLLPDQITIPLVWLGLLVNINHTFTSPTNAIIGAASGYLFLWTTNKLFKLIRKKEGMGYGDFKLFAVFGAWLGWRVLPLTILMASILGTICGILFIVLKKQKISQPLPFGPYLAIAGWLAFFYNTNIYNLAYIKMFLS